MMVDNNSFLVDVRELNMERGLNDRPDISGGRVWFTLGPFNWLYVARIDNDDGGRAVPLDKLRGNTNQMTCDDQKNDSYYQHTYLMREYPVDHIVAVDEFWSTPAAFMIVTRVNGNTPQQLSLEESISSSLGSSFTSLSQEERWNNLSTGYIYEQYRTIDLTDVVVILRAQTITPLLQAMGKLYKNDQIGDTYSVCCIEHGTIISTPTALKNDDIQFLSMRLSVKNSSACDKMLQELQNFWENLNTSHSFPPPVIVTGPEDINVVFSGITTYDMCQLYHFLLGSTRRSLRYAIDDIISRIGIDNRDIQPPEIIETQEEGSSVAEDVISVFYKRLKIQLSKININPLEVSWLQPLNEVLNALISIGKNSILRQLCYILAVPLHQVIERLLLPIDKWEWCEEDINQFLAGFVNIIEYTSRLENSLVQSPEIWPRIVDIPSGILEYDLALVTSCAEYLKQREVGEEDCDLQTYSFLLNPCLCTNITIHDWFNTNGEMDNSRLLYVEIPLSLIYSPFDVACDLIHEVSHHSGSTTRNRASRRSSLLDTAVFLLVSLLGLQWDIATLNLYSARLRSLIEKNATNSGTVDLKSLEKIKYELYDGIMGALQDKAALELIVQDYISSSSQNYEQAIILYDRFLTRRAELLRWSNNNDIWDNIDAIISLYSECYADISMMSLLGLNSDEYIRLFNDYFNSLIERDGNENGKMCSDYANLITRISLVLLAQDLLPIEADKALPDLTKAIIRFINNWRIPGHIEADFPGFDEDGSDRSLRIPYFPDYISGKLLCYLNGCYKRIRTLDMKNQEKKDMIYEMFDLFANKQLFASDAFYSIISTYRNDVINYSRDATKIELRIQTDP